MLKFIDGRLAGLMSSAGAAALDAGAGGGKDFAASLPEPIRTHEAFKDVKDVATLATKYHERVTAASKPFAEQLPEDIRGDAAFKDIKDLPGLAKSYQHAAKMVGLDKARVLAMPANDDAKEWHDFANKLGRPESAEKYAIPKRADGKDYSEGDVAFQKALLPALHEADLTQRQVALLVPAWNKMQDDAAAAAAKNDETARATSSEALKKEWGTAYDDKLGLAHEALVHFSGELKLGDALAKELDRTKLGNSPALAKLLAHLGGNLKEDGLIGKGGSRGAAGELSPTEAEQQINAKRKDEKFMKAYGDKREPGHADAVKEMERLYQMKNPPRESAT